mgnify:FL=1
MIYVYLLSILAARVVQAVFSKLSSNEANNIVLTVKYTAYQYSVSAALGLILLLADMSNLKIDLPTLGIALLSGVSLFFSTFFSIYGMKSGTVSLVSMFGTAGLLVPIIAGVFLFGQPVSILQGVGTAIFFVSAWLLIKNSKNTYNGFSLKTLLLLIGAMLANGLTMLAQQMYTYYVPNGSISLFSFLSFGSVAAAGLPTAFAMGKSEKYKSGDLKLGKTLYICGIALAAAVFVINQFATKLTALLPPVFLFTFINGGGTIISTLAAAAIYKEKLSVYSILGVIIGICSMIMIKLF